MTILIAGDPIINSYLNSLIEAYKKQGNKVLCGTRNFFLTNFTPDILHIQWPESIFSVYPFSQLSESKKLDIIEKRLKWFKENKTIMVQTIHNIVPHNPLNIEFEKKVYKLIIRYADILVHHCKKSIEVLKNNYPESESNINVINHHPDYLIDYIEIPKSDARKKLNLNQEAFIILNFGSQQKYKGEDFIESVFNKVPIENKFLLTAGNYKYESFFNSSLLKLKIRNKLRQRIRYKKKKYIYKKITQGELPYFLNSADILFLAHQGGSLNSGILPLAATFGKPVVFPDIGCFKEQMKNWVYESYKTNDINSAVNAVNNIYEKIKNPNVEDLDNSIWLKENSWEKHIKIILEAVSVYNKNFK